MAKFVTVHGTSPVKKTAFVNLPDLACPEVIAVYKQHSITLRHVNICAQTKTNSYAVQRNETKHEPKHHWEKKKTTIGVSVHRTGRPAGRQRDEVSALC